MQTLEQAPDRAGACRRFAAPYRSTLTRGDNTMTTKVIKGGTIVTADRSAS